MKNGKVVTIEDRIPKLKAARQRKANRRFILYLSIFFLLILLVVYLQSPLSKVGKININGNHYVTNSAILKSGGLSKETSFWNINTKELEKKITASNLQISDVTIKRQLPNVLSIEVNEFARVAYLKEKDTFHPILENGKVIHQLSSEQVPVNAPILIDLKEEQLEELASELKKLPQSLIQRISEIKLAPSETVSYDLIIFMNDGFEVRTSVRNFAKNMKKYPSIVSEIERGKKGIIHINVSSYFEEFETEEAAKLESEG